MIVQWHWMGETMDGTVEVTIPAGKAAAAMVGSCQTGEIVGRFVSYLPHPRSSPSPLVESKAAARAAGLTDEDTDAEITACNAERRARSSG